MESMVPTRPLTCRVENIPPGTTAEALMKYFYTEDQPRIRVRSIVPAVDSYELDIREYTATVTFQALNGSVTSPRLVDEDISLDRDFYGFTPLNHPQEPIAADIIAVTGLAAHAFGSWAHSAQNMWLRDYLPRDISNARVLIYGYPSQLHGNTSRSILSDHSTNMIHRLLTMREMAKCQDRPIVFIGHSLGCLIIKKVLCDINGSVGIYSSRLPVRSIIFMGAPHKGLETTALETLVKSPATEDMIRELKSESPTLTELNDKFRHVAKDIDILTCYELNPTKTAIEMPDGTWKREGPPMMMVSLDSARQWYPREEFVACNADHSQIAKLKRGENSIYPSVRWAIKKALLSAGDLYSEAKGTHDGEPRNLESADEASAIRRSLLQVRHRQTPIPSIDRTADPAPMPSRSPSEDTIDQHIKRRPELEVNESAHRHDTQSKSNSLHQTVSQWRSGIEVSEWDDTQSSANPTKNPETEMTSVLLDNDDAASKSTDLTISRGAEFTASKETREETNPDPVRKEVVGNTALQAEDSTISTNGTKSMIMDKVMESAITGGDEAKTRELLAHFYDVNCKGDDGITPLLLAARYRHEKILTLLLEQGAHPRVRCDKGRTTLHWLDSVPEKPISETLIDLLLRDRPPFDVTDGSGATPLMTACRIGELFLATRLVRHGADVRATDSEGATALHCAAYYGKVQMISLLIDHGAELEARSNIGETPLYIATLQGQLEIVKALLDHGANIEARNNSKLTSLQIAVIKGQFEVVKALLDHDVNIEAQTSQGWASLFVAAREGHLETVKTLLDHDVNIEAQTSLRWTPLHIAAEKGHLEIVKALLNHGVNIEARTDEGWTPLHNAVKRGHLEIVKALLDHGANCEGRETGWRPLHMAADWGHLEVVRALLAHGADPTARTTKLVGQKPSSVSMNKRNLPFTQRQAVKALLKEAEKTWKESSGK